jgi:hypothetical protein
VVDKKLVKSVGEHWVCSVMAALGWAVALTRDGLARTDLLGLHTESGIRVEVQVKSASFGQHPGWMMGKTGLLPSRSPHEWYVFVALPQCPWEAPRGFVVPRDHAVAGFWIAHQDWLANPMVVPGKRNASILAGRVHEPTFKRYENKWELLSAPTTDVPVLLPPSYRDLALSDRVGLPPNHPWLGTMPEWS